MSLSPKKYVITAKIESVQFTDSTPDATLNAMLCKNLRFSPLKVSNEDRNLMRPYYGNSEQIPVMEEVQVEFDIEIAGAGAAGAVPAYGPLLRACAFAQTANTAAITITRASSTATATETGHGRATGDVVAISGATETEYNGNQTITVTGANTYTFTVTGTPATPATGSPVAGVSVVYNPISSAFEYLTLYVNRDGRLGKLLGAAGNVTLNFAAKTLPFYHFTFTGKYTPVTDLALPGSPVYTAFQTPRASIPAWTGALTVDSFAAKVSAFNMDMANEVSHAVWMNQETLQITDRKPKGAITVESVLIAAKDYFNLVHASTLVAFNLVHGINGGNIVKVAAPKMQLIDHAEATFENVMADQFNAVFNPNTGNDEATITVK